MPVLNCVPVAAQSTEQPSSQTTVILEGIVVTPPPAKRPARRVAKPSGGAVGEAQVPVQAIEGLESANPPAVDAQQERFVRRSGAELVVPVANQEPQRLANPGDVLSSLPGVFVTERGAGSSAFISIRGSDIGTDGSRNGRGIRAYLDGFPLGRTEAGLTNQLIDISTVDYLEVYRGGNSLRYGAIATGGALNFVSKTGRSAPGSALTVVGGSFGYIETQLEHGGSQGAYDWYLQGNWLNNEGYVNHTEEKNYRFSGNIGWRPNADVESRTFFAVGETNMNMGDSVRLDQLEDQPRGAASWATYYNAWLDFDYQRIANRTTIRDGDTTYELGAYFLNTALDHLPVPMAGIIDYGWKDAGVSGRVEHKTSLAGLPTELVAGMRIGYTAGDFDRFRHVNEGQDKGQQLYDWDFSSWLIESYAESAVEVLPRVRVFTGLQGVYTTRVLDDQYAGGQVNAVNPMGPPPQYNNPPQPGRIDALLEYDRDFAALNPKVGINWEHTRNHFLFANVTRSYEVPSGADFANVFSVYGTTGPQLEAQSAWTWETGVRGGWKRFQYDLTLYHMALRDEILTRCADPAACTSSNTVAFNADRTIHDGIELGLRAVPLVDTFTRGDSIFTSFVWNYTDFRFDSDAMFGNANLPVIPEHQLYGEIGYQHPAGYFGSVNLRYVGERNTTFDGAGGQAFVVPDYTLFGAKVGWQAPDRSLSVFLEGRNLTDEIYVADFAASPTVPVTQNPGRPPFTYTPVSSPSVRPGDGRALYGGVTVRF